IRLISGSSPDVRDDLSADPALARLVTRHQPAGGGHDRCAHAAEDPRDVVLRDVAPPTRPGDTIHAADHRAPVLGVAELDLDHLADPRRPDSEVGDVALLLENPRHLALPPGGW